MNQRCAASAKTDRKNRHLARRLEGFFRNTLGQGWQAHPGSDFGSVCGFRVELVPCSHGVLFFRYRIYGAESSWRTISPGRKLEGVLALGGGIAHVLQ